MPKYLPVIIGGLEIAAGVALEFTSFAPLAGPLISAGAGTIVGGPGACLAKLDADGGVICH